MGKTRSRKTKRKTVNALVRSFVFCQFLSKGTMAQTVSRSETTIQKQARIYSNKKANANADSRSDQYHFSTPKYWPRFSGTRRVRLLDGIWNSSRLESPCDKNGEGTSNVYLRMQRNSWDCNEDLKIEFDSMDPKINISEIHTNEQVTVPSTIEVVADPEHGYLPGYMGYRGVSFFRTNFETNENLYSTVHLTGPAARILFQACSFYCRVWLNGVEIGDHIAGGYVAWWLDVSDQTLELGRKHQISGAAVLTHELFVLVDNRFNSTTAPLHTGGDFWHYGGIIRSVEWHDRPNVSASLESMNSLSEYKSALNVGRRLPKDDVRAGTILHEENIVTSAAKIEDGVEFSKSASAAEDAMSAEYQQSISALSSVWPWRLYISPQEDLRSVKLSLQMVGGDDYTRNRTDADLLRVLRHSTRLRIYFDGDITTNVLDHHLDLPPSGRGKSPPATLNCKDRLIELGQFLVPNSRRWSTKDPHLHTVSVDLNGAIVTERFGLRFWDTSVFPIDSQPVTNTNKTHPLKTTGPSTNKRIRLNGEVIKLLGWNHHTQWPYTGMSPTDEQLDEDIKILKELGHANFVRGAHYPQDPRWLDRLDEHGIVAWCETLGPGVSTVNLRDEYFLKAQNQQVNEMLDNAFNHASIAFWAFFNEGPSDHVEACEGYQASSDAILARDSTRFVTYASNQRPPRDKCYHTTSVISYNGYPGWYDARDPKSYWDSLVSQLQSRSYPGAIGKPILISETGAGGIFEWKQNRTATKWTLRYQSDIVSRDVDNAIKNKNISGISLWHFFDFKVNDRWENNTHCDYLPDVVPKTCGYIKVDVGKAWGRPGGANHKGSVDFFRRPKPIFSLVASQYENASALQETSS